MHFHFFFPLGVWTEADVAGRAQAEAAEDEAARAAHGEAAWSRPPSRALTAAMTEKLTGYQANMKQVRVRRRGHRVGRRSGGTVQALWFTVYW